MRYRKEKLSACYQKSAVACSCTHLSRTKKKLTDLKHQVNIFLSQSPFLLCRSCSCILALHPKELCKLGLSPCFYSIVKSSSQSSLVPHAQTILKPEGLGSCFMQWFLILHSAISTFKIMTGVGFYNLVQFILFSFEFSSRKYFNVSVQLDHVCLRLPLVPFRSSWHSL